MTDENNSQITYIVEYENINRKTKKKEKLNLFIIMTKSRIKEIRNKEIYQYCEDATYRCVPPNL